MKNLVLVFNTNGKSTMTITLANYNGPRNLDHEFYI
jgi:hypothetical protein